MSDSANEGNFADAVAALKAAQGADKLYKAGDHRGQGLIAAANYRRGCAIFVRIVDDANTDEAAKVAIRPKIAQIRGRLKKLEAALPEAAAAASREAVFREQTAAATAIQACVRGRSARRLAQISTAADQERNPQPEPEPEPEPEREPELEPGPEPRPPMNFSGRDRRPSPLRRCKNVRTDSSPRLQPREYLGVHVYPHLQPALQACERLRPADSLGFLAECLLDPAFLLQAAQAPRQAPGEDGTAVDRFFAAGSEEKRRLNAALVELNQTRPADPIGRLAELFLHHRDEISSEEASSNAEASHMDDDPYGHRYENTSTRSSASSFVSVDDDRGVSE